MEDSKLILKDEVYQLIGCAMEVLNGIGHGFHEKIYENALVVEFKLRGVAFDQQRRFAILYKEVMVGEFIPDLITHAAVGVDTKCIDRITAHERRQMINYLRIAKLRVNVILNFKHSKLEWERIVL